MDDLIEHIALELESTSFWRDQKAAEFPDDKQRNEEAAQLLQRLADNVRAMAGSELALELQKANEELGRVSADFYELTTEEDQYRSRIGFDHFPSNGSEYLGHLLDIYRRCIATASERLNSDANGTSVRPPPPSMQPPPGWTAGVDDATNKIIQQTEARRRAYVAATTSALGSPPALLSEQNFANDVASHSTPPQPEFSVGVTEPPLPPPPPTPPLEATPEDEPPKIVGLEARGLAMSSGAATIRTNSDPQAGTSPTSVGSETASAESGSDEPPIDSIPQQVTVASQFTLDATGRIDLVPDPPDHALLADAAQRGLYEEIRHKALALSDLGHNQLGDLSTPIDRFRAALPESIEAVSITRLWSRGNTLRRRLHAHETVARSAEPDPARLPTLVAETLADLVETYNAFIADDPKGRELDQVRLGPQERDAARAVVDAAVPILQALQASKGVATPAAIEAVTEQIEAARNVPWPPSSIYDDQAIDQVAKTSSNLTSVLLRVVSWFRKEAAHAGKEFRAGIYRWSGPAVIASGQLPGVVAFVVENADKLKILVTQAFHNPELIRIIDAIVEAAASMPLL